VSDILLVYAYDTYEISTTTFGHLFMTFVTSDVQFEILKIFEVKELTPVYNIVTSYSATSNIARYLSLGG